MLVGGANFGGCVIIDVFRVGTVSGRGISSPVGCDNTGSVGGSFLAP